MHSIPSKVDNFYHIYFITIHIWYTQIYISVNSSNAYLIWAISSIIIWFFFKFSKMSKRLFLARWICYVKLRFDPSLEENLAVRRQSQAYSGIFDGNKLLKKIRFKIQGYFFRAENIKVQSKTERKVIIRASSEDENPNYIYICRKGNCKQIFSSHMPPHSLSSIKADTN